jgi:hypothetical protein
MSATRMTEAQVAALAFIAETGGKSGGFYADFGHRAATLSSLRYRGFLETGSEAIRGALIYRSTWRITPAGRLALAARNQERET